MAAFREFAQFQALCADREVQLMRGRDVAIAVKLGTRSRPRSSS
jgi:hypothetical protein